MKSGISCDLIIQILQTHNTRMIKRRYHHYKAKTEKRQSQVYFKINVFYGVCFFDRLILITFIRLCINNVIQTPLTTPINNDIIIKVVGATE